MRLRYIGSKPLPYRLPTPVPLRSLSEKTGEIIFNPEADVPEPEWVKFLLEHGFFEKVPTEDLARKARVEEYWKRAHLNKVKLAEKNAGRWFVGRTAKAIANRFIKDNRLGGYLEVRKLLPYGGYILLAIPEPVPGGKSAISAPSEGQGGEHERGNENNAVHIRDLSGILGNKIRRCATVDRRIR